MRVDAATGIGTWRDFIGAPGDAEDLTDAERHPSASRRGVEQRGRPAALHPHTPPPQRSAAVGTAAPGVGGRLRIAGMRRCCGAHRIG